MGFRPHDAPEQDFSFGAIPCFDVCLPPHVKPVELKMNIHDVALVVFAELVRKDNTGGHNAHNIAAQAYHFAEAFMQMRGDYGSSTGED